MRRSPSVFESYSTILTSPCGMFSRATLKPSGAAGYTSRFSVSASGVAEESCICPARPAAGAPVCGACGAPSGGAGVAAGALGVVLPAWPCNEFVAIKRHAQSATHCGTGIRLRMLTVPLPDGDRNLKDCVTTNVASGARVGSWLIIGSRQRPPVSDRYRFGQWELANPLSREREHRVRDCGRYGRNAWLTDASGRTGAFHDIDRCMPRCFVDAPDPATAAKVLLLDGAALHRDAAVERQTHPEDHRTFELGAHAITIDDGPGIER